MSVLESFLAVLGNRRVVKSLGSLVLMAIFAALYFGLKGVKLGPVAVVGLLIGIAFVVVIGYFRGEPNNILKTIEEVVEEKEQSSEENATEPEGGDTLPWSEPLPTLDVLDPATPDPPLIKALGPTTISNWPNREAEPANDR